MREGFAKVDGLELHYVEEGEGRPLLYVHGNLGSSRWFERVMAVPGWRAIALDMPNFGRSDSLPGAADIDRYADCVALLATALNLERPVICAHSLGGAVAISLVARRPEFASGLVLVDSAAPSGLQTPPERHPVIEMMRQDRGFLEKALAPVVPTLKDSGFFKLLADDACRMAAPAWVGNAEALSRFDYRGRCGAYEGPVLALWGRLDAIVTEAMAEETAAAFPGARLEKLEGIGHSPIVENPARFLALLTSFLSEVSS